MIYSKIYYKLKMNPTVSKYNNRCSDKNMPIKKNNINILDKRNLSMKQVNSPDIKFITFSDNFNINFPKNNIYNEQENNKLYSTIFLNHHKTLKKFLNDKSQKTKSKLVINEKYLEFNKNIKNKLQLTNSKSIIQTRNKINYDILKSSTDEKKANKNKRSNYKNAFSDKEIIRKFSKDGNDIHLKIQNKLYNSFDDELDGSKQNNEKFSKTLLNMLNDRDIIKSNVFIDGIIDNVKRKIEVTDQLNKNIKTEYFGNLLSDEMNNIKENNFNLIKDVKEIFKNCSTIPHSLNSINLFSFQPESKKNNFWKNNLNQIVITPTRLNEKLFNKTSQTDKKFSKKNFWDICINNNANKNYNHPSELIVEISNKIEKRYKMKSTECQTLLSQLPELNSNNYIKPPLSTFKTNKNKKNTNLSNIGNSKKKIKLKNTSTKKKLVCGNNQNEIFVTNSKNNNLINNNKKNNTKVVISIKNKQENENFFNKNNNKYTKNNDNKINTDLKDIKHTNEESEKIMLFNKNQKESDLQKQDLNIINKNIEKKDEINAAIKPINNINSENLSQKNNNDTSIKNPKIKIRKKIIEKAFKSKNKLKNGKKSNKNGNESDDFIDKNISNIRIISLKNELNLPELKIRKCKSFVNELMRHNLDINKDQENNIRKIKKKNISKTKQFNNKINITENIALNNNSKKYQINSKKLFYDRIDIVNEIKKFEMFSADEREELISHGLEFIFLKEKKHKTQLDLIRINKERQKIIKFIEKYLERLQLSSLITNKKIKKNSILKLKIIKKYDILNENETQKFEKIIHRINNGSQLIDSSKINHIDQNNQKRKKKSFRNGKDKSVKLIFDNSYLFKKLNKENCNIKEEILDIINNKNTNNKTNSISKRNKAILNENTSNYSNTHSYNYSNYSNHSNHSDTSSISGGKNSSKKRDRKRKLKIIKEGMSDDKKNKKNKASKEDEIKKIQREREKKIEEDKKRKEEINNKKLYEFFEKVQLLIKNYDENKISELISERINDNPDTLIYEKEVRKKNFFNDLQMKRDNRKTFERYKERNIGFNSPLTFRTTTNFFKK